MVNGQHTVCQVIFLKGNGTMYTKYIFNSSFDAKRLTAICLVLFALAILLSGTAEAGTSGTVWKPLYDEMKSWSDGYAGKIGGLVAFVTGIVMSKFQPPGFLWGGAGGLGVAYGPGIGAGMVSAII